MQYPDPTQLKNVLSHYYSSSELRTLCFELGIEYEDLGGRGKSENAFLLVKYMQSVGRLHELVTYIQRTRPHVQLNMRNTPPPKMAEDVGAQTKPSTIIHVSGDMVQGDKMSGDKVEGNQYNVGDISNSSGVAIGKEAKATGGHVNTSSMVGSVIGSGSVKADNIAGGDINIGTQPETKEAFGQQVQALQTLLTQAVAAGEFTDARDGAEALQAVEKISTEISAEHPHQRSLNRFLNNLGDILGDTSKVIEGAGKTGTAVLKAVPIVAGLIKAAGLLF